MTDLIEPGYRPAYTGADLGDVGSGSRLGAHLYYLYRAGRNELPAVAGTYAELTRQVHGITEVIRAHFDRPGRGMHQAHLRLLELRDETHDVFRQTCLRLQEVGVALVETANDYAGTDCEAADEFCRLLEQNAAEYDTPPPFVPDPPQVDDPPPPPHLDDGHLAGS